MRIFISAGEPSGDLHAANLIRALRERVPDADFVGFGGSKMQEAGARLLYPLVNLAVMWFLNVLLNIVTFIRLIFMADAYFRDERPDAVVLVDYPGLHWWIAKRAKARGIPVFYFVPPQLWAWAGWRVEKVRKYVDQVLCSLPFEPAWYQARGVEGAIHVGHPYFDELADRPLDEGFLARQRAHRGEFVAILPGSRTQEVLRNLPDMLRAAKALAKQRPGVRFAVACLHERHKAMAERMIAESGVCEGSPADPAPSIEVHAGRTPELIRLARVAWAVSGSVGLELMVEGLPTVVLYKIKRFDLWVARWFIKAKYISLVNLLADAEVFPEYLTWQDASGELVRWASAWLDDPEAYARTTSDLAALRERVARPGASDRAADHIVAWLHQHGEEGSATVIADPTTAAYRGPHEVGSRREPAEGPGSRQG
ncbi:MAG: lipid-A-disaccharide synthase [Isosphaeraceae bacterium]